MKALYLTNEFPPNIYGGAGVHVDYLTREMAKLCQVEVRCFGEQQETGLGFQVQGFLARKKGWTAPAALQSVFGALDQCLQFNTKAVDADVVHLHTWYTHFGGILAKLNYGIPMVLTTHSLEPLRPWKREQLGGGYDCSRWVEKTAIEMADAVVAVSEGTKKDVLEHFEVDPEKIHVIYNGIDPQEYQPIQAPEIIQGFGIDPEHPYILFVGRITRQKGIIHLVRAIRDLTPGYQVVLCAGAPDTPEIAEEMKQAVAAVQAERDGVFWLQKMVDNRTKIALYSHAAVFCCPSIYEPFGIINLEAMACGTAVVASAVGGIKEVVLDGITGFLVPVEQEKESPFEALHPEQFSKDLAEKINACLSDETLRARMAEAGRHRAIEVFSWQAIAQKTFALYQSLQGK
ncbi:MAG: glycogen synthase [Verrucomicrobiota bacterium]